MKQIIRLLFKSVLWVFLFSLLAVSYYGFLPVIATPLMLIRCVEHISEGKMPKLDYRWRSMSAISEDLALASVCSEDQNFIEHQGFDIEAIKKAIEVNKKRKKKGKPVRGASTISQQTAKNVFLFPQRSFIRKGLEVFYTFAIEILWTKERILQVYLNVIEMGDGIYGAQAASRTFFHKNARDISLAEAATIAACYPNPRKWNAGKPDGYVIKRRNWILRQMAHWGGELEFEKGSEKVSP